MAKFSLNLKGIKSKSENTGKPETTEFDLKNWYASEPAKRSFGRICQAVNEEGTATNLLGSIEKPLLVLADADEIGAKPGDVEITIDEAKADWSNVTVAVAIYGTRFRIRGRKKERAVLFRHPDARHPAERYMRSGAGDVERLAKKIEALAQEVRQLGQQVRRAISTPNSYGMEEMVERLSTAADLIERRFREVWRLSNAYPA